MLVEAIKYVINSEKCLSWYGITFSYRMLSETKVYKIYENTSLQISAKDCIFNLCFFIPSIWLAFLESYIQENDLHGIRGMIGKFFKVSIEF